MMKVSYFGHLSPNKMLIPGIEWFLYHSQLISLYGCHIDIVDG
jgi:hypothetical protein